MFAEDKGPEYVRQPVKCYKLTLTTDLAGLPVELGSCIKYDHSENVHLCKRSKNMMDNTIDTSPSKKKDDNNNAIATAKTKFTHNKKKKAIIDVVINGTGPVQSYLSAALARNSCNVLHCDGSAHYGGPFWTLSLINFHNYLTRHVPSIY